MAVDSQAKRMSAVGSRRLPWLRRFSISDGTIGQGDRQATAFVYSGILAGAPEIERETHPGGASVVRVGAGSVGVRRRGPGSVTVSRKSNSN